MHNSDGTEKQGQRKKDVESERRKKCWEPVYDGGLGDEKEKKKGMEMHKDMYVNEGAAYTSVPYQI